jgi:hypothetical protein
MGAPVAALAGAALVYAAYKKTKAKTQLKQRRPSEKQHQEEEEQV